MTPGERSGTKVLLPPRCDPFTAPPAVPVEEWYAGFRAAGPLLRAGPGVWALPRYGEVAAVLRDPRVAAFRFAGVLRRAGEQASPDPAGGSAHSFLDATIVAAARPDHARLRNLLAQLVVRRLTPALDVQADETARRILDRCAQTVAFDAVPDLAFPLPLQILSHMFGLPDEQAEQIGRNVLKLSKLFSPSIASEDQRSADAAVSGLRRAVATLLDARRRKKGDDICSEMSAAIDSGLLSREEAIDNAVFLLFAGLETSVNMIAAGCAALADHPHQLARLRADPSLAESAVEEVLRYDAPTQMTARMVTGPINIAGRTIGARRVLLLLLGSANHDPDKFRDPSRLDIGRKPNLHLAFGAGAHACLGAGLARLLGCAVFRQIAKTLPAFEPAGPTLRDACVTPRIYLSVPLRITSPHRRSGSAGS
jgi:cytochrome P450